LYWARTRNLPVVHVHSRREDGVAAAPIPGFEPRPTESLIYKSTRSLFDSVELKRAVDPICQALVLGFTGAGDCVAAAVDAARLGVRLVFITDAVASPMISVHEPEVVEDVVNSVLQSWAACVTTSELFKRGLALTRT
jgi:hypothetical protein